MVNSFASYTRPEEWSAKLQERLNYPTCVKETCDVIYSNTYVFHNPYMSTETSVQTGTRGSAYSYSDFATTDGTLTISSCKIIGVYVDRADLAQQSYVQQMYIAENSGQKILEAIESAVWTNHAAYTDFGDTGGGALGLGSTAFTVSSSNIDDIITGVIREIRVANGQDLLTRNGAFFVWRPADFELVEKLAMSNGFTTADEALRNGLVPSVRYMGAQHFVTNSNTSGHIFAGVKKIQKVGILRGTYGQIVKNDDPGLLSGVGYVTRVDYGLMTPAAHKPLIFDINVN